MDKANAELLFTRSLNVSTREHSGKLRKISLKQTQDTTWLIADIWKSHPQETAKVNGISGFRRGLDTFMDSRLMRWYSGTYAGTPH